MNARIHPHRRAGILLNALVAAVVLVNPLAAAAAPDCSALQSKVDELQARVNRFEEQALAAERALSDALKAIASILQTMDAVQQTLPDLLATAGPEVAASITHELGSDAAKAIALHVLLAFAGGPLGEVAAEALEAVGKLALVNDLSEAYEQSMSAMDALAQLSAASPDFAVVRDYAREHDLPDLEKLADQEWGLAQLANNLRTEWGLLADAEDQLATYRSLRDLNQKALDQALDDLAACLAQQPPPAGGCSGGVVNPSGGAGVCR